jgi:hypothetical protein
MAAGNGNVKARLHATGGKVRYGLEKLRRRLVHLATVSLVTSRILAFWSFVRVLVGIFALVDPNFFRGLFALSSPFMTPLRLAALYLLFGEVFAFFAILNATGRVGPFFQGYAFLSKTLPALAEKEELPKIRVQNRITLVQVLVGIAGVMVAFTGQRGATSVTQVGLTSLVASILLGVLYIFVLGGTISEDKTHDEKAVVVCSMFHEVVLEMILNVEVVLLVLGSAIFFALK